MRPRKKVSRLNSPKMDMEQGKVGNKSTVNKGTNPRNRNKTNSQYSSMPSHVNEFKNIVGLAEAGKDVKGREGRSPSKKGGSKNRIPKSQEREQKSNSDNTMEDVDENLEEFKSGENQNR